MPEATFKVPLLLKVMVLSADPKEPNSKPSLLARVAGARIPPLTLVPPLYLLVFLMFTVPVPSTFSEPSPKIEPLPARL
ncbi:Uncharacterised protein [Segatella copri]|nr:Uncharacterised protein [Segatella copri]